MSVQSLSPIIKAFIYIGSAFLVAYILYDAFAGPSIKENEKFQRFSEFLKNYTKIDTEKVEYNNGGHASRIRLAPMMRQKNSNLTTQTMPSSETKDEERQGENEAAAAANQTLSNTTTTKTTEAENQSSQTVLLPTSKEAGDDEVFIDVDSIWSQQDEPLLPLCPEQSPALQGKFSVDMRSPSWEEITQEYPEFGPGGRWRPANCTARNRVAIIIPFRDREPHLQGFLHNAHRMLQRQQLDYAIFVVEQYGHNLTFNKGRLMNAGVLEALKLYPWQCVVFHDVDTVPENDMNIYSCPTEKDKTKHLGVAIEKQGYKLLYQAFLGGATVLTEEQFRRANGYSNDFWGWGGEDDDFYYRVTNAGMSFWRPAQEIGRYRTFEHERDHGNTPNPCRFKMLEHTKEKQRTEGVANVRYRIKSIRFGKLYTHIMVDVLNEEYTKWLQYVKTLPGC